MHYALNTFNLALVIVVTALSIQPKPNQLNKMEEPTMKQDNKLSVLDNIHARTSIRSYQPKEVEDEKIEQLLRAAMAAPTATNRQPWAFIVIRDKETMNELGSTLPYAKMVKDAPLAIAVCFRIRSCLDRRLSHRRTGKRSTENTPITRTDCSSECNPYRLSGREPTSER